MPIMTSSRVSGLASPPPNSSSLSISGHSATSSTDFSHLPTELILLILTTALWPADDRTFPNTRNITLLNRQFNNLLQDPGCVKAIFFPMIKAGCIVRPETIETMLSYSATEEKFNRVIPISEKIASLEQRIKALEKQIKETSDHEQKFELDISLGELTQELTVLNASSTELLEYKRIYENAISNIFVRRTHSSAEDFFEWIKKLPPEYKRLLYENHLEDVLATFLKLEIGLSSINTLKKRLNMTLSWIYRLSKEQRAQIKNLDLSKIPLSKLSLYNFTYLLEILSHLPNITHISANPENFNLVLDRDLSQHNISHEDFKRALDEFRNAESYEDALASLDDNMRGLRFFRELGEDGYNALHEREQQLIFNSDNQVISIMYKFAAYGLAFEKILIDFKKLSLEQIKILARYLPFVITINIALNIGDKQREAILKEFDEQRAAKIASLNGDEQREAIRRHSDRRAQIIMCNGKYSPKDIFMRTFHRTPYFPALGF